MSGITYSCSCMVMICFLVWVTRLEGTTLKLVELINPASYTFIPSLIIQFISEKVVTKITWYILKLNDSTVVPYHDSGTGKAYSSSGEVDGSFAHVVEFLVTDSLKPLLKRFLPGIQLQHLWTQVGQESWDSNVEPNHSFENWRSHA